MRFSIPTIVLALASATSAKPVTGHKLVSRQTGFTCEVTSRVAQTPALQPVCVSAGDCPYVAFSSKSGLATGCATADQCCVRFRCTTSSGKSGVCKSSSGCGGSGCPSGSGCCSTSSAEAPSNGQNPQLVSSNPSGEEPTGEEPTGEEPTGEEPTGEEPTGEEPTGEEPTGEEPTGEEPTGEEPTDEEPTGEEPSGEEPSDDE